MFCLTLLMGLAGAAGSVGIADIQWRLGPNVPEHRKGGCLGVLDNKVVSAFGMRYPWGEMATTYVYDPEADWWERGPEAPVGQCYVQGAVCQDALYSVGGRTGDVSARCFRLARANEEYRWSEIAPLHEARAWAPSVCIGSTIVVFGGSRGGHGPTINSVEMLDVAQPCPAWQTVSAIPGKSHGWLGAATARGKAYLVGGAHIAAGAPGLKPEAERLAEVLEFNPETGAWQERAPLLYRLSGMDCGVYLDRYLVVVGGAPIAEDFTPEMKAAREAVERFDCYYCPFVLVYDTQTDRWSRLPSLLPMPTNDIRVAIFGKTVYALGGENVERATSNTTAWFRIGTIVDSEGTGG